MKPNLETWKASYTQENQMRICVDGTANLRCAMCEQFAYHSQRTEIVSFLCKHKENWMHQVSFPCTGCPLLASG